MKITVMGVLIVIGTMVLLALIAEQIAHHLNANNGQSDEQTNNPS